MICSWKRENSYFAISLFRSQKTSDLHEKPQRAMSQPCLQSLYSFLHYFHTHTTFLFFIFLGNIFNEHLFLTALFFYVLQCPPIYFCSYNFLYSIFVQCNYVNNLSFLLSTFFNIILYCSVRGFLPRN